MSEIKRAGTRPRLGTEAKIDDATCDAFIAAHPGGATLEEIAEVFGVTRWAVGVWERNALAKLRPHAEAAGLEWSEPTHRPCVTDEGDGAEYSETEVAAAQAWREERAAANAKAKAAREMEANWPSPLTARLSAELDAITWKARRASLALGEIRERALAIDAAEAA